MRIVALDLGTNCGVAWSDDGLLHASQCDCWSLSPGRTEKPGSRYLKFVDHLNDLNPQKIFFELVRRHEGTQAAHVFGGLLATMQAWGDLNGVYYHGMEVGTIKKFATGKGNANKAMMIEAARTNLGYSGKDDNEADALWILAMAVNYSPLFAGVK
jgi:hypothetical protein